MKINGHLLPPEFMAVIQSDDLQRSVGSWPLLHHDSFGNKLESEIGQLYRTENDIISATSKLPDAFSCDGSYGEESDWMSAPGFIPDIQDFSHIISFGTSGDDSPFCFDFREKTDPVVIWWDDVYWRKLSPDFKSFLELIKR